MFLGKETIVMTEIDITANILQELDNRPPESVQGSVPEESASVTRKPLLGEGDLILFTEILLGVIALVIWLNDVFSGKNHSLLVTAPIAMAIVVMVIGKIAQRLAPAIVVAGGILLVCTGFQVALNAAHSAPDEIIWQNYIWAPAFGVFLLVTIFALLEINTIELPSGRFYRISSGEEHEFPSGEFKQLRLVSSWCEARAEDKAAKRERKMREAPPVPAPEDTEAAEQKKKRRFSLRRGS